MKLLETGADSINYSSLSFVEASLAQQGQLLV